ncbi:MAG: radical SAM protein [candidate division WOR-3 bacterium]|nr:radical SAM protein [candidate division WOR-3 bacterium]
MKLETKVKINNLLMKNLLYGIFHGGNNPLLRPILFPVVEKGIWLALKNVPGPVGLPGVIQDKFYMLRAMVYSGIRFGTTSKFTDTIISKAILSNLRAEKEKEFREKFGFDPPGFMTISPAKKCNLRCKGCYANSASEKDQLPYDIFSRVIKEMRELWGARFVVISGGEPMMYKWNNKTIVDIFKENPDSLFLMYTNGSLINEEKAKIFGELGNVTPAVSVEGLKETTEQRRGKGFFERIVNTLKLLKKYRVTYGISITATRDNAEEIVSDEFIDFYFNELGAAYAWVFHYMPIGRDIAPELIPTPEQRVMLWRKSWEIVRDKKIMYADFWNHGPVSDGCISAGRPGGYFYIDWQANVYPCVFFPYAAGNIKEIYENGGNLNDLINLPLNKKIREWQFKYWKEGDLLRPCPIRDHYMMAKSFVLETNARPADEAADKILKDPDYEKKMLEYDTELAKKTSQIWEMVYRNGSRKAI